MSKKNVDKIIIIEEFELLSIDGNTYLVRRMKDRMVMRCKTCTTKSEGVDITEEYLQQLLDFKTMKKI
jgi:hypothetical protein